MNESPRWLITKQRYDQVYKILFKHPSHYEVQPAIMPATDIICDKKSVSPKYRIGCQAQGS